MKPVRNGSWASPRSKLFPFPTNVGRLRLVSGLDAVLRHRQ